MGLAFRMLALVLIIAVFLSHPLPSAMKAGFSQSAGGSIDVFTQREPYSGKGLNMPSDAFGPEESIDLNAIVTYWQMPVQNLSLLVAFHVWLPNNATFSLTARTNSSGIAKISFTISTPPVPANESDIFGSWRVLGDVMIEDTVYEDSLAFRVDWIVKVLSVRTINQDLAYWANFGEGGDLGLEITLRSVAMTLRKTTVAIVIYDELNVPVNYTQIDGFNVPPNERLAMFYCKLQIPTWAYLGNATVFVSALTAPSNQSGTPYCPPAYASFMIRSYGVLTLAFHDAAIVDLSPSSIVVEQGQYLNVSVLVRNEGTEVESFNVSAYLGDMPIETHYFWMLQPYAERKIEFTVDTVPFAVGEHSLYASIPSLANEADLADNNFTGVVIEIKPKGPVVIHNIAIINVTTSNNTLYRGDSLQVRVEVKNKGTEMETFNVTAFYDSSAIGTNLINNLAPAGQTALFFNWNTTSVPLGQYSISASSPLDNDTDMTDNVFIDGTVEVKVRPPPQLVHDIAVTSVSPSSNSIYTGDAIDVVVVASNQGGYSESFNVSLFYGLHVIGTMMVGNLAPGISRTLIFGWTTLGVSEGNYTIRASATEVLGEQNVENNELIDGNVEIKSWPPPPEPTHDVAVMSVVPQYSFAYISESMNVTVTVKNKGDRNESFSVFLYYDHVTIASLRANDLTNGTERVLTFRWSTQGISPGNYTLSAYAETVQGETSTSDNTLVDGIVRLAVAPMAYFTLEWFYLVLVLLLLLLVILIILLLSRRRRKKDEEQTFYSAWNAWYYKYDLPVKRR